MNPTPEQLNCAEAFDTGLDLRISAYAGTGKTTTLKHMSAGTKRHGTYLAFNKSIADEARARFPRTVTCATTHSMAFRSVIRTYDNAQKLVGSVNAGYLAAVLRFKDELLGPNIKMTARGRGYLIAETLKSWQRSGADSVHIRNVPLAGALKALPDAEIEGLAALIARDARDVWARMVDAKSTMPLGHDGYLKLWALGEPQLPGQFILLDEAQDTNGVILELMKNQNAQLVAVGDANQQIYEWRGARNAMVELPAEMTARLSTSFRFGPNIAGFASSLLELLGERIPLTGNSAVQDALGPVANPRAILCRTNGRLLEELLSALDRGERPHVVGGTSEVASWLNAAEMLQNGVPVESPIEFFGFTSWDSVRAASETDEGADLKRVVKTVDSHGISGLRRALSATAATEEAASLILATGHKSKGREWDSVRLCDDFLLGVSDEKPASGIVPDHSAELRLLYVAATRGKQALDMAPQLLEKLATVKKQRAVKLVA